MKNVGIFILWSFCFFITCRSSLAILGTGDIVYDPANVAQTINVLKAAEAQLDRLGTLLGVSTRQLDQLTGLAIAIGNAKDSIQTSSLINGSLISASLNEVPDIQTTSVNTLFDTNGLLDAFMGMKLDQWIMAIEKPTDYYRREMINPAIARIGSSSGLTTTAIDYTQWYAAQTSEDQSNLSPKVEYDISNLLDSQWLAETKTRRINLQQLSVQAKQASDTANSAANLSDLQRTEVQLGKVTNEILIETAAQAASSQESSLRTNAAQSKSFQNLLNTNRDSALILLNNDR